MYYHYRSIYSIDEQIAIEVLQFVDGPTVLQYVKQNWNTITNDEFRNMLCQVAHAMKSLHEAGIIHRNIHFDSVIVAVPSTTKAQVSATTSRSVDDDLQYASSSSSSSSKKHPKKTLKPLHHTVTCYLGDMWFLFNPRIHGSTTIRSGAQMGRADWGAVFTAPPEAKTITSGGLDMNPDSSTNSRIYKAVNARMMVSRRNDEQNQNNPVKKTIVSNNINSSSSSISDRSDVYAFGVCVYYWATGGLQILPLTMGGQVDMITVRKNMPLKWKPWLISLLEMCLQTKPEMRASAKDIHLFLSSRFGKT